MTDAYTLHGQLKIYILLQLKTAKKSSHFDSPAQTQHNPDENMVFSSQLRFQNPLIFMFLHSLALLTSYLNMPI